MPGTAGGKSVAIVGHIDEIGLIVHHIDDDGFLWFTGVGGWDPIVLVGQRVAIATRAGAVPGRGRQEADPPDEGGRPQEGPAAQGPAHRHRRRRTATRRAGWCAIGDVAVIAGEPVELPNNRFISRSMDNRLGCYVALEAARLVAEAGGAPGDVYALAVSQEEITFGGARTTAYSLRPDVAIAVDVTFATDQPGIYEKEVGRHKLRLRRGAHARLDAGPDGLRAAARDGRGRGHPVHRDRLRARHRDRRGRDPHSPAPASRARVVSVPLRYMHSPVEMVQLDDVANAAKLIAAFAQRLPADTDFKR